MLLSTNSIYFYFFTFFLPLVNLINKYIKIAKEVNLNDRKTKSYPSKGIATKAKTKATKKSWTVLYFKSSFTIVNLYLKNESTNSYLLNTCKSSIPSPTPIYFTGI